MLFNFLEISTEKTVKPVILKENKNKESNKRATGENSYFKPNRLL